MLGVGTAMEGLVSAATVEDLEREEGAASKTCLPLKNLKGLKTVLLVLSLVFESLITALEVPVCYWVQGLAEEGLHREDKTCCTVVILTPLLQDH